MSNVSETFFSKKITSGKLVKIHSTVSVRRRYISHPHRKMKTATLANVLKN